MLLDARIDIGQKTRRPRKWRRSRFPPAPPEVWPGSVKFGVMVSQLYAEGQRLGMNAVAAPHCRGHFMLEGAALDRRQQGIEIKQQVRCLVSCTTRQVSRTSRRVMP